MPQYFLVNFLSYGLITYSNDKKLMIKFNVIKTKNDKNISFKHRLNHIKK